MSRVSLLVRAIDAIDRGEIPLALAIELDAPHGLARAWDQMKEPHVLFEMLLRTRRHRMKIQRWARSAAYFAGIDSRTIEAVLRDHQPIPESVAQLRPSSPRFWAWEVIKEAMVNTMPSARTLYNLGRSNVPDDFILDSMLRPEGPPTIAEIIAAAEHTAGMQRLHSR